MKDKNRTKAIILSSIWGIAFLGIYAISFIEQYGDAMGLSLPLRLDGIMHSVIPLVAATIFFPLLLRIRHHASLAKMEKLAAIASSLSIMLAGILLVSVISLIV